MLVIQKRLAFNPCRARENKQRGNKTVQCSQHKVGVVLNNQAEELTVGDIQSM
jgi:hypothetical protein